MIVNRATVQKSYFAKTLKERISSLENNIKSKEAGITKTKSISFTGEKDIKVEQLILNEVKRLAEYYNKAFLDCEEIIELTGLGRDNVRALMNSKLFPVTQIGNRKIVSILAFVTWQMTQR